MKKLPVVTTSERTCFRRCPQQWHWRYRLGLVPRGVSVDALWFGIGVHEALAKWYGKGYRRSVRPATTFAKWCGEEEREIRSSYSDREAEWYDEPKYEDAMELGIAMLEEYVATYGKDQAWEVIATERPFKVLVTWHDEPIAEFWSTWDGVYYDNADGRIKLMEHKTARAIQTAYLALDDQAGAYWAVAGPVLRDEGVLGPKDQISEITYNFLRKAQPDPRPQNEEGQRLNQDGTVSKRQPPPLFHREPVERLPAEQRVQMERLAGEVAHMNAIRRGELPVIKNTTRDCPYCPFFLMCQAHEHGGNGWEAIMRADFDQINPYERYIKSA